MDILRFINSKDIRKHLKDIDYKFNSLEAAWLIYQCHDATIDEKHKICDPKFHPAFNMDELKRIAITFHSSKGLEFEQVVLFVSDYRLSSEKDIYNHYVAATRAKNKLILVYVDNDWNAGQFRMNINKILGKSSLKMKDVATVVNCIGCLNN